MKIIHTIIVLLLATTVANAYEIIETVTEVIDGDTFKTTERGKPVTVRIADIDCPELQQPGGQEAKQFTTKTLLGTLISIKTSGKKQKGILTGKVITNRGKDMAVLLIQKGLAWPAPKTKNKLVTGQCEKAISNKTGIWGNGIPEPPWQYRSRTYVSTVKKKTKKRISLYGDSALDIARDPDGSAVGDGGGMTIAPEKERTPAKTKTTNIYTNSFSQLSTTSGNRRTPYTSSKIDASVKNACKKKWGTDYSMVKYCIEKQATAKKSIGASSASMTIKSQCREKWGKDYSMVNYCIEKQAAAKSDIRHLGTSIAITRHCERKWGTDYSMVKYCIKKQSSAKRALGY